MGKQVKRPSDQNKNMNLHGESWLSFSPNYQVSSLGRVKNFISGLILKMQPDHKGYLRVTIQGKTCKVHRLVAHSFIPNPENKPQVNHINGIKHDNRVENLEWNTGSENSKHSFVTGLQSNVGENHPSVRLSENDVRVIRALGAKWCGVSRTAAGSMFGMAPATIKDIRQKRSWTHI